MKKVFNANLVIVNTSIKGSFSTIAGISELLVEMIPENEPWDEVLAINISLDVLETRLSFKLFVDDAETAADFIRNVKIAANMRFMERKVDVNFYEISVDDKRV